MNFNTYSHDRMDVLGYPYDLKSIMHYDNKAFSFNARDTLQKIGDPFLRFGNQQKMSSIDIKQLQKLYKCKQPHSAQGQSYINNKNTDTVKWYMYIFEIIPLNRSDVC